MDSGDRFKVLLGHLQPAQSRDEAALATQPCASTRTLPRFDVGAMERFLDEFRDLKAEVYGKLEQHPELLLPTLEGLSKGQPATVSTLCQNTVGAVPALPFAFSALPRSHSSNPS